MYEDVLQFKVCRICGDKLRRTSESRCGLCMGAQFDLGCFGEWYEWCEKKGGIHKKVMDTYFFDSDPSEVAVSLDEWLSSRS